MFAVTVRSNFLLHISNLTVFILLIDCFSYHITFSLPEPPETYELKQVVMLYIILEYQY